MSFLFGSPNNGRVNFTRDSTSDDNVLAVSQLPGFGYRDTSAQSEAMDAIRGNVEATPLNQTFFSPENVRIVQNKIRREVYDRSGGDFLVDPQSVDQLLIVMRAMYLQYGRNQPTHIAEQIAELNQLVANFAVPDIVSACSMDRKFIQDITTMPIPLSHPVQITQKGSKSASFDRFF